MTAGDLEPAVESDYGGSSSRRGRGGRVALAVALLAMVVAVGLALVSRSGQASPDEALRQVRSFVAEQRSARFTGGTEFRYRDGDDEVGSTSVDRSKMEGEFALPDRIRVLQRSSHTVDEYLQIDGRSWSRWVDAGEEISSERWVFMGEVEAASTAGGAPSAVTGSPEAALAVDMAAGFFGSFGGPLDFDAFFGALADVERLEPGVLRGTTTFAELLPADVEEEMRRTFEEQREALEEAEEAGEEIYPEEIESFTEESLEELLDQPVTATVRHGPKGRLDGLVIEVSSELDGEVTESRTELAFTDWGAGVRLAAPGEDEIDHTPGVDEEALANFRSFALVAPAAVPSDWLLHTGEVIEEDPEFGECESVTLSWSPKEALEAMADLDPASVEYVEMEEPTTIEITLTSATCDLVDDTIPALDEGEAVTVDGRAAALYRNLEDAWFSYLSTGLAVVSEVDGIRYAVAATHLSEADLVALASDLRPFELSAWTIADAEITGYGF